MVSFRAFSTAAAAASLVLSAFASPLIEGIGGITSQGLATSKLRINAPSPVERIVNQLSDSTQQLVVLQGYASQITVVNAPLLVAGGGPYPPILSVLFQVIKDLGDLEAQVGEISPISSQDDSDYIYESYRTFSKVQQVLLSILTTKASLSRPFPFVNQPVAAVLRSMEGVNDRLMFSFTDKVSKCLTLIQTEGASLGKALELAITAFEAM